MVYNDGELVNGCPYYFRVLPPLTKIKSPGMDPCAIGSIVEVLVNSYGMRFYTAIRKNPFSTNKVRMSELCV